MVERQPRPEDRVDGDAVEIELADADILDAMGRIPGYLDIGTEDFRVLYHLAHRHALERLLGGIRAGTLMRRGIEPLAPGMTMEAAARALVARGQKSLPVADAGGRVLGMLTETDFLRRLEAGSFLELLLRLVAGPGEFTHRCHETLVGDAMTRPPVTVGEDAGFRQIAAAFHRHEGRTTPVVDAEGRLRGLLLRVDFLAACKLEGPL